MLLIKILKRENVRKKFKWLSIFTSCMYGREWEEKRFQTPSLQRLSFSLTKLKGGMVFLVNVNKLIEIN